MMPTGQSPRQTSVFISDEDSVMWLKAQGKALSYRLFEVAPDHSCLTSAYVFEVQVNIYLILCPSSHLNQWINPLSPSLCVTVLHQCRSHGWSECRDCSSGSSITST